MVVVVVVVENQEVDWRRSDLGNGTLSAWVEKPR